ncbi:MAG: hypothetical protein EB101_10105 [Chitinophagia bacterium]|nr:hypothetical protein [Chitinophagia bacterium]
MYKNRFEDGGEIGDYYRLESDAFNFDPNDVDLSRLGFDDDASRALFPDGMDADSSALGALQYMPVDQQQKLLEQFYTTEEGKRLTPEQRTALENEIYGQSDAETKRLERQAGNEGDGSLKAKGVPIGGSSSTNPLAKLLSGQGGMSDLLRTGLAGLMAKKAYDEGEARRRAAAGAKFTSRGPVTATRTPYQGTKYSAAGGGIGSLEMARGGRALPPRYLNGHSDGMADKVPAHIDNKRPAALSDGEFVIPADVVSHLGNGNSNAGAKRLYEMMDRIRAARTGNRKQGKQINPDKFMLR